MGIRKRRIGRTDLEVTELGFGGTAIGGLYRACPREQAMATLDAAWQAGIRLFDNAPLYGYGLSERLVGDYLRGKSRDDYVLVTKVGRPLRPLRAGESHNEIFVGGLPFDIEHDYSYDGVMRSLEQSYARLGLNHVDILLAHDLGVDTHGADRAAHHMRQFLDGGLKALDELKSAGEISAYGLGVNEIAVCLELMRHAPIDCILLAGRHTLLDRSAEDELIPFCREKGTSLIIGGVFNSGILATGPSPEAHFNYAPASSDILDRVGQMEKIANAGGFPLAAAALQFPLLSDVVASVLLSTARPGSLQRNLSLMDLPITAGDFARFEDWRVSSLQP
jgi:D-threo-aldose 1-dehydrogenase